MLINSEVLLTKGEEMKSATVKGRSKHPDGISIGILNKNTVINSIFYYIELNDSVVN